MIGRTFSHFRVTAVLGEGGMGQVYAAHDERLGRDVALKLLHAEGRDATARARLLREARAASAIEHPNVCTIYEVGEADGEAFIAMELVRGESLQQKIARGAIPPADLFRWGAQVADALAAAHARGVVHRDLKSSNVLVTPEGRVKVLDFGLARIERDDASALTGDRLQLTTAGMMVGTPHVIAPEVLRGASGDARADVWALGVLLFEMTTGRLPFGGRTVHEIGAAVLRESTPSLPSGTHPALARLIVRCLDKDPAGRVSAAEARDTLQALAGGTARGGWMRWLPAYAGAILLALAIVLALDVGGWRSRGSQLLSGSGRIRSIAVLPLDNLNHDPAQDYLADGLTEGLISELAQIGALRVISRTSVMPYRGTRKPMKQIAQELNVDALIEGSVLRAGDRVRVTAQLIDGRRDRHLWAHAYDRPFKDVLALQDDVASDVAERIRIQVTPVERKRLAARPAGNAEVTELVLQGRHHQNEMTPKGLAAAMDLYRRALEIDPKDARPWSGLADAYVIGAEVLGTVPFEEAWPRVRELAGRALALDETLPEAHTSMAAALWFADWDFDGAEREFKRAVELNPSYALGHDALGLLLVSRGKVDEGLSHTQRALDLDPRNVFSATNAAFSSYMARRWDESLARANATIAIEPRLTRGYFQLARVREQRGELAEAIAAMEAAARVDTSLRALARGLRAGLEARGEPGYWSAQLAWARTHPMGESAVQAPAMLDARLGRPDSAFAWLEGALARRDGDLVFMEANPAYDPLRKDPRFAAFLRRISKTWRD